MKNAVKTFIQQHTVSGIYLKKDRTLWVKQEKKVEGQPKPIVITKTIPLWEKGEEPATEAEQKKAFEKAYQVALATKRSMQMKLTNRNYTSFQHKAEKLGNGTLGGVFDAYFQAVWGQCSEAQQKLVKLYVKDVFEYFGRDKILSNFEEEDISMFKEWLAQKIATREKNMTGTVSNNSINKRLGVIRSIMKIAIKKRLLNQDDLINPDARVKNMGIEDLPRGETKPKPAFTIDEQEEFISTSAKIDDQEWTDAWTWLFETGMRHDGEFNAFTVDNVDFGRQTVRFKRPKTKKWSIEMPLTDRCFEIAKRRRKLAMTRTDRRMFPFTTNQMDSKFERVLKHCNFNTKFTKYCTRHTFITRLAEADVNQKVAQEMAGHACIETTLKYYSKTTSVLLNDAVAKLQNRNSSVIKRKNAFSMIGHNSRKALK